MRSRLDGECEMAAVRTSCLPRPLTSDFFKDSLYGKKQDCKLDRFLFEFKFKFEFYSKL